MGIPLDHGAYHNDQLLQVAADHARDIHALCTDVATVIFPSAMLPPTEAIIAAVSNKLRQIIADIEAQILPDQSKQIPLTWPTLARSGFLREPDLIDSVLARVAEDRLERSAGTNFSTAVRRLLDDANPERANAAQKLLAAESLHGHETGNIYRSMPPELLHKLCWRIVAAHEIVHGTRQPQVVASARALISRYSEADRTQAAARKIVHFSSAHERLDFLQPSFAGIPLHVAALSTVLELEHDHVLRLIDAGSSTPYATMLAAAGVAKKDAIEAIYLFRGPSLTPREGGIIDAGYASLTRETALAEVAKWASVRTSYLAFGQP
jgi:hypothetical protein